MPRIAGQVVILTVSDADQSATWYCDLLGMEETSRYVRPDGHIALIHLVERRSGVELCLVCHRSGQAAFDEFRIGLDHLEFLVAHRDDLDTWVTRLTSWEYTIPASSSPPAPPMPWSPSAIQTTFSLNSSGDRPSHDQAVTARPLRASEPWRPAAGQRSGPASGSAASSTGQRPPDAAISRQD